jgi:hypothetical protein
MYCHGIFVDRLRGTTKFFKQERQKIIRNSNPVHPEYQPRISGYTNLIGDYYEVWYVGYLSMLYQVHRILTSNITRRHLCCVDIEVSMAYFEVCPNIHLKELRKKHETNRNIRYANLGFNRILLHALA